MNVITHRARRAFLSLLLASSIGLTGCASSGTSDSAEISDPFEGYNRAVFAFNDAADTLVLRPVAKGYRQVVPKPARTGVRNVLRNLKSPVILANQVLQGDLEGAGNTCTRAVVNTLIGVGGIFDVAGSEGIAYEPEDFGQTLAVWGVDHGAYMVLPIYGPSSTRDFVGTSIDTFADPLRLYLFNTDNEEWYYARVGVTVLDSREELLDVLDDLRKNSIDYYAALRSVYVQRRQALVNDENPENAASTEIPDFDAEQ